MHTITHKQILKQVRTLSHVMKGGLRSTSQQHDHINEPSGKHSDQVRCTVHSMLWHADIQNITVDVTFRRKATGFGITSKNKTTNDYMIQKVKQAIQKESKPAFKHSD